MAGADSNFEGFSRLYGADPTPGQQAPMKEGIARSIRECDEAKSLLGAEPFDNATSGWSGRSPEPRLTEPGRGAECTRLSVLGISVEFTTPRITEILVSQFGCS